jgi:3'(2'), 5'-bisphosphate nucleotidase
MHAGVVGAGPALLGTGSADGGSAGWTRAAVWLAQSARAAGLHASRLDGSPLHHNQPNPYLLICRPELADRLLAALAAPGGAPA